MFDIIGDIHGYASTLKRLLDRLGYQKTPSGYAHPTRTAIFVGDLVDRGPEIPEVVEVVRKMVDGGHAQMVLGNHEWNTLAFFTKRPGSEKTFRPHNKKNISQQKETLNQLQGMSLRSTLQWFSQLPIWIDTAEGKPQVGIRVVHACWNQKKLIRIRSELQETQGVTPEIFLKCEQVDNILGNWFDDCLKGPSVPLPKGITYKDTDGNRRGRARIRWFQDTDGKDFDQMIFSLNDATVGREISPAINAAICPYNPLEKPVFFGHYWMPPSTPKPLQSNVACVDFSVARGGFLCSYRWDGEKPLQEDKFVFVTQDESDLKHLKLSTQATCSPDNLPVT